MSKPTFGDIIIQDFWIHLAALLAIGLGAVAWYMRTKFAADPSSLELMFMVGGFSAAGLKIVNGSAAALRQAALDTAFTAARSAGTAAAAAQLAVAASAPLPASPATGPPPAAP